MLDDAAPRIRVLIVDDSAVARRLVAQALRAQSDIEVMGFAENGRVALERVACDPPDAIVLDLEMPEMDGVTTLYELKRRHPEVPVLVFSAHTSRGASATVEALMAGANDYALKPRADSASHFTWNFAQTELATKLRSLADRARRGVRPPSVSLEPEIVRSAPRSPSPSPVTGIVIGTSSGGPEALALMLPMLPASLGIPMFIVQHMPKEFTLAFAKRLNEKAKLRVIEAAHGQLAAPDVVYLAPGDHHLRLSSLHGRVSMLLDKGPLENGCRPSVDPLFRSAASVYGEGLLALVLTGMGSDGVDGARAVMRAGGHVWVQDRESSLVWGMPGAVTRAGLAERTYSLRTLAPHINTAVEHGLPAANPAPNEV